MEWLLFKLDKYKKDLVISDQSILEVIYHNCKCNHVLDGIICKEYARRIELEESLKLKFVKFIVEEFNSKTDYYCSKCPNISFLSQMHCNKCRMKTCILHSCRCRCEVPDIRLFYRKLDR